MPSGERRPPLNALHPFLAVPETLLAMDDEMYETLTLSLRDFYCDATSFDLLLKGIMSGRKTTAAICLNFGSLAHHF